MKVIKVVEAARGMPGSYMRKAYAGRRVLRVVCCRPDQHGWRSEKDVEVIWTSEDYAAHSKGPKSKYQEYRKDAEAVAERARRCLQAGLCFDAPDDIVSDRLAEMAGQ